MLVRPVGCFKDYIKEETNGLFIKKYTRESFCEAIDYAMSLDTVQMQPKIEEYFLCEFSMKKVIEKLAKLIK